VLTRTLATTTIANDEAVGDVYTRFLRIGEPVCDDDGCIGTLRSAAAVDALSLADPTLVTAAQYALIGDELDIAFESTVQDCPLADGTLVARAWRSEPTMSLEVEATDGVATALTGEAGNTLTTTAEGEAAGCIGSGEQTFTVSAERLS
jgi:hypothetical protein